MGKMRKNRAFFLDRDGILIEDRGFICDFEEVRIFPFSVEAVRLMNESGFKVIVVTNQSSVARGICTEEQVRRIHEELTSYFSERGAVIDQFYYSPYHPEGVIEKFRKNHESRKPSPGMILEAAGDFDIDVKRSYMIGNSMRDILAGRKCGCKTIFVEDPAKPEKREELERENVVPDIFTENILTAVKLVLNA